MNEAVAEPDLAEPKCSVRELAIVFTEHCRSFISEAAGYGLLEAADRGWGSFYQSTVLDDDSRY